MQQTRLLPSPSRGRTSLYVVRQSQSHLLIILQIGVPGAFTIPCSAQIPGYIETYDQFKAKGVSDIYVIAVNDAFVTK